MHLNQLILTNFKNYEFQKLDFSEKLNCFTGMNGMGKTNLLDAIYYLCMTKSNFNTPDQNILKHEQEFFRLEAHFERLQKMEKVVAKVIPRKKKDFERNDVPYQRLSEHIGMLPVVIIAPDDTFIITEGSEARRRFIDNTLSQLDNNYLNQLILYNKVLKQRNATLKQFYETNSFNPHLMAAYDEQLTGPGTFIFERRTQFLEQFSPILVEMYKFISGKRESIQCQYKTDLKENAFDKLLQDSFEKDRILQRTTKGIHKDELIFTLDDFPLKRYGSQGQIKSYLLALKLAQYEILKREKNIAPILLLDDIFDKLDNKRVAYLLQLLIRGDFGQIFITDTHDTRVSEIIDNFDTDYKKFIIESGTAQLSE